MSSSKQINRITLFKVPEADIPACMDAYVKLQSEAKKVLHSFPPSSHLLSKVLTYCPRTGNPISSI